MIYDPPVIFDSEKSVKKAIVWLHGLGADGHDFLSLAKILKLPAATRFIFPHAPVRPITVNGGYEMRAWYDITEFSLKGRDDQTGIETSARYVHQLLEEQHAQGLAYEDMLIAGFSQGAALALHMLLHGSQKIGGVIALSGYLPPSSLINIVKVNQKTPVFIAHGNADSILPISTSEQAKKALSEEGYSVDYHEYSMAHELCQKEINDLENWLTANMGQ